MRSFLMPATLAKRSSQPIPRSSLITIAGNRSVGALGDVFRVPLTLRAANALVSYARYISKTLFPTHLTILYPYPGAWPGWTVTLCCLVLLGVSALAVRALRNRPYLFVGWFWFLGGLDRKSV